MEPRHGGYPPPFGGEQSSSTSRFKSKIKSKIKSVFRSKPPLFDPGRSYKTTIDATILPSERFSSTLKHRVVGFARAQIIYRSLDPHKNEFRLLRIDNIDSCCPSTTLHTFNLDTAPAYYALSYHWGSTSDPLPVTINGHHRKVTKNLSIALHQLYDVKVKSRLGRDAYFWIDAICINQEDFEERNHQVTNMRTIYSQAEAVYISVGDAADDSHLVPSLVQKLVTSESDPNQLGQIKHPDYYQEFRAFGAFLLRDYWSRVWVVQEVNLAKQAYVLCGKDLLAWGILLRAQNVLVANSLAVLKLEEYERRLSLTYAAQFSGARGLLSHIGRQEPTLFEALKWHCEKEASLPEDKVYAILGITTAKDDPALVVDYSRGVEQLYIDTTKYIIQSTKRLDVICAMQKNPFVEDDCEMDIPTWTVNWVDRITSYLYEAWSDAQATGSKEAHFEFSSDNKSVTVEGIYLSTISSTATHDYNPYYWDRSPETRHNRLLDKFYEFYRASLEGNLPDKESLSSILRLCKNFTCGLLSRAVEVLSNLSDEAATEVILSIFAYRLTQREIVLPEAMIVLATKLRARFHEEYIKSWSNFILDDFLAICTYQKLFMCDNGLFGSGYWESDISCEVWAIMGCDALVVLKGVGKDEDGKERYEVVGNAYVDGYMYGKVLIEVEEGKREVKKIVLV